jgi:hypothetical protein
MAQGALWSEYQAQGRLGFDALPARFRESVAEPIRNVAPEFG